MLKYVSQTVLYRIYCYVIFRSVFTEFFSAQQWQTNIADTNQRFDCRFWGCCYKSSIPVSLCKLIICSQVGFLGKVLFLPLWRKVLKSWKMVNTSWWRQRRKLWRALPCFLVWGITIKSSYKTVGIRQSVISAVEHDATSPHWWSRIFLQDQFEDLNSWKSTVDRCASVNIWVRFYFSQSG